jgi:hypothetical protein
MRAKDFQEKKEFEEGGEKVGTPSQLFLDALRTRPRSTNTEALLAELSGRLEYLAQKAGASISEFLAKAESNPEFNDDYLEALSTARQIARLKATR